MRKILNKIENVILKNHKVMAVILICELFVLLLVVNIISQSVVLNDDDEQIIGESGVADEVSCSEGLLAVNKVSVAVPEGENVSYDIAYSWGSEDSDYPSVPHAAIASFAGENGKTAYDISLYRDSYVAKADIPKGKNADNWFDDWEPSESGDADPSGSEDADPANSQKCVTAGDINGFLIAATEQDDSDSFSSEFSVRTFYFAQEQKDGLAVYILEGNLYDPQRLDEFETVFANCMKTIKR